jgi:hypothetical protein
VRTLPLAYVSKKVCEKVRLLTRVRHIARDGGQRSRTVDKNNFALARTDAVSCRTCFVVLNPLSKYGLRGIKTGVIVVPHAPIEGFGLKIHEETQFVCCTSSYAIQAIGYHILGSEDSANLKVSQMIGSKHE